MKIYLFGYRQWAYDIVHSFWFCEKELQISGVFTPAQYEADARDFLEFYDDHSEQKVSISAVTAVDPKNLSAIRDLFKSEDLLLFYGWSWMVPKCFTDELTCICLHPSPLPKYRGGSPIQNQVIAGEKDSAITLFLMGQGLDDGPIFYQEKISLDGQLHEIERRIALAGFTGTNKLIQDWKAGILQFTPQDETQATFCKRRKPSDSEILPTETAEQIYNKVRCLQDPYPNAYFLAPDGKKVFLKKVDYER